MAQISAALVKELREKTGAGMMDCKKALTENDGDMEAAVDWLRKKGIASAAKKEGRTASEGLVATQVAGNKGAVIELNSETDFVARNEQFQTLAGAVVNVALEENIADVEALKNASHPETKRTIADEVTEHISIIGENIQLRRSAFISVDQGVVVPYVHNAVVPGAGKIAVLIALESSATADKLEELGKKIAMHVAATNPESLSVEDLSQDAIQRERDIFSEQAKNSGKPENIIEKMVEGRLRKFYEEVVLLEQTFVIDNKTKIKEVLAEAEKEAGTAIALKGFIRFQVGEGIEKEETDFAQEVAQAANG